LQQEKEKQMQATDVRHAERNEKTNPVTDLFVDSWGTGTPVVLVHGSLATGAEEWEAQRPLADQGFRLLVPDRRGYGQSPSAEGEDFLRDGDDIAELMGDGAHLVGHSYGGLGVMFAAAVPLVPVLRRARQMWSADLPLAELEAAQFPKLVVSGGHHTGFEAICDDLADRIGASRTVVAGAGHEIQFTGAPLNDALLSLWRTAR
jgi:pimeloyl-ACP methyl ester carboxylesterase